MNYQKLLVENPKRGDTIYSYLRAQGYSENYLNNIRKDSQNLLCNGVPTFLNVKLKGGEVLELNDNPNTSTSILPCAIPLDIVFEDENMLVVNKPAGLSSMPNQAHYTNNLAGAIVHHMQGEPFVLRVVNRLDKDTQGRVMVAKSSLVYKPIFDSLQKTYHAIVCGRLTAPLTLDGNIKDISEQGRIALKRVVAPDGKKAITHVKPLQVFKNHTLVEVNIEFGRTHQIRVHLSHADYPLLGDYLYGQESELIAHTALVCKKMSVVHPQTKEHLCFEVDYGQSFLNALEQIKKA